MRFVYTLLICTFLACSAAYANGQSGYFLVFHITDGHVEPPMVMVTSHYVPNRTRLHAEGWRLRALDGAGVELFVADLDDPLSVAQPTHSSPEALRLVARIPQLSNALSLELLDPKADVAWRQAIDVTFRAHAQSAADEVREFVSQRAQAPKPLAGDSSAVRTLAFQEQRRQARVGELLETLSQPDSSPEQRTVATQSLQHLHETFGDRSSVPWMQGSFGFVAPQREVLSMSTAGPLFNLMTGNVQHADGTPLSHATVRAYRHDTGAYVISTLADFGGNYAVYLAPGTYDLELSIDNRDFDYRYSYQDNWIYITPAQYKNIVVNGAVTQNFTVPTPERTLTIYLQQPNVGYSDYGNEVQIFRAGQLLGRQGLGFPTGNSTCTGSGSGATLVCKVPYSVKISPGLYDLRLESATTFGFTSQRFNGVDLTSSDTSITIDIGAGSSWQGQLLTAEGAPITNASLYVLDLFRFRAIAFTDANGRFAVPVTPGWSVQFPTPTTGNSVGQRITVPDVGGLPSIVHLESVPFEGTVTGNLTRIYTGDHAASDALRIVFLGDGYTDRHETFTDINGNGVWDGVLWYDLNGNGVYDAGEPYAVYGSAEPPTVGSAPDTKNEPFTDLNGDHFPNFDDHATFTLNAQTTMRQLLGADYWEKHRSVFQADASFIASDQAGVSISGTKYTVQEAFSSTVDTTRFIIGGDQDKALQIAEQLEPGFDYVVVMVNEPIPFGRGPTSLGSIPGWVWVQGGPDPADSAESIPHEMGHFVGLLDDEYSEFAYSYNGTDQLYPAANATTSIDYAGVPWKSWLDASQTLPTRVPQEGIGLFEGADYVQGGVYRPSWTSMMRDGISPFNAPSVAALDTGLKRFINNTAAFNLNQHGLTGSWYNPATGGQGIEIEVYPDLPAAGNGVLFAGWFTYDVTAAGGQRWYALQGSVSNTSSVSNLAIATGYGGNFNAQPPVNGVVVGAATLQFNDCNSAVLNYAFSDGTGRTGTVPLVRLTANTTCAPSGDTGLASDYLLSGNWFDINTGGQGLIFDINPSQKLLFAAWYTFAPDGQQVGGPNSQRWYVMQGAYAVGAKSVSNIPIAIGTGGVFNNSAPTQTVQVGTADVFFQSCNAITLVYRFTGGGNQGLSGSVNLSRVGPTPVGCNL